jgi:hypothetical protein
MDKTYKTQNLEFPRFEIDQKTKGHGAQKAGPGKKSTGV